MRILKMPVRIPNESETYRRARKELLQAEKNLRSQIETVAKMRRDLPLGGVLKKDYLFDEINNGDFKQVKFSELFISNKNILFLYSFMYDSDHACPMCTALIDALNGQARHLEQKINLVIVAKNPIDKIKRFATSRNWKNLRFISSANNSYNSDYFGEIGGQQTTTVNVFQRMESEIRHFWNSELSYEPMFEDGNMRHLDLIWPLWNVLDMTPNGRGNWYPKLNYE